MRRLLLLTVLGALALSGCATNKSLFSDPGTNLATPTAMAFDVAANRFYVVNSNAKVLYDSTKGSFQAYDVSNPLAPVLVKSTETPSFSGQMYLDAPRQRILVPNRYTKDPSVMTGALLDFNNDETSADFLTFTQSTLDRDPYAIACCYPADRAWVTTSLGELDFFSLTDVTTVGTLSLLTTVDSSGTMDHAEVNHIVIVGNQAFLSRELGGVMVVNLDKAGVAGAVPVDYFIADIPNPRGLAYDGRYLYVVEEGNDDVDGDYHWYLLVLDVSSLTPTTGNTTTHQVDKNTDNLLVKAIDLQNPGVTDGKTPEEVQLTSQYAFVTNQQDNTVGVLDIKAQTKVKDIPIGDNTEPFSLALYTAPDGTEKYLYVGNAESNTISIIDIPTLAVVATYP